MAHVLSKTTFMYGCQCTRRLWLHKYKGELRNAQDEQQQAILDRGTSIGELARQLFRNGVDASLRSSFGRQASPPDKFSYHIAVAKTKDFIDRNIPIIYEAAFQYEGVFCAVDILVRQGEHWHAFEVKSTTSVKSQHIQDAALQYYVITHCGLPLQDISIIYLNNEYTRKGKLDVRQLFATTSVLELVMEQQEFVHTKIEELKATLAQQDEPLVNIGTHCSKPYDCDFTNHCWAHVPKENSVFELPGQARWKLYANGYKHLDEIPYDYALTDRVALQVKHHRSGEVFIDKQAIQSFLAPLTYPLYFFDFETIMPGVPEFDDSKPYQQIPFQFSLHVLRQPGGELEHVAYLGDGEHDPRPALMEAMLLHLGETGSIICYSTSFEKTRIKELATLYPQYETELLAINERVLDLMIPFQKRWYYHPAFKGKHSIKVVLPVLIPELRYDALNIPNGSMASLVYAQLKYQINTTAAVQRQALLEYCKMDTLAMVKIWEVLKAL